MGTPVGCLFEAQGVLWWVLAVVMVVGVGSGDEFGCAVERGFPITVGVAGNSLAVL